MTSAVASERAARFTKEDAAATVPQKTLLRLGPSMLPPGTSGFPVRRAAIHRNGSRHWRFRAGPSGGPLNPPSA
jgi:hypothetical protein